MIPVWFVFLVGVCVGACLGVAALALLVMARQSEETIARMDAAHFSIDTRKE